MFVGHFAIAFILILLFPQIPVWVPLFGVSFPDLLWGTLVLARTEEVIIDKNSPLQKAIIFKKYPYSHSLVLTGAISLGVGALLAIGLGNLLVLPVFALASSSHWILDTVVHLPDLSVLGFDGDRKVGLGLWKRGRTAFLTELVLFVISAVLFVRIPALIPVLVVGLLFHGINANSFFGSSKKNLFGTPRLFATVALIGFAAISAIYSFLL